MTISANSPSFDQGCERCPRLASLLAEIRADRPDYYARPVPSFGDPKARLLVVGLAPGMHGANRTGRPFTGDFAGVLLYQTLHKFGFSSRSEAESADDGLELYDCRIANAVKCLPPLNKPTTAEIKTCNRYLAAELNAEPRPAVIIALGRVAHNATLTAFALKQSAHDFGHGNKHQLAGDTVLIDSYHCSRYNTQTKRLTEEMFEAVFRQARELLTQLSQAGAGHG